MVRASLLPALALALSGCLNVSTVIRVAPDGSGAIEQTLLFNPRNVERAFAELGFKPSGGSKGSGAMRPVDEAEVRRQITDARPRIASHLERVRVYAPRTAAVAAVHAHSRGQPLASVRTALEAVQDRRSGISNGMRLRQLFLALLFPVLVLALLRPWEEPSELSLFATLEGDVRRLHGTSSETWAIPLPNGSSFWYGPTQRYALSIAIASAPDSEVQGLMEDPATAQVVDDAKANFSNVDATTRAWAKAHLSELRPQIAPWVRTMVRDSWFLALLLLGLAILLGSLTPFALPLAFMLIIHFRFILPEEAHMERAMGEPYLAFKAKVRRWL